MPFKKYSATNSVSRVLKKWPSVSKICFCVALFFSSGPIIQCGFQVTQYSTAQNSIAFNSEKPKGGGNDQEGTVKIIRRQRYQLKVFMTTDSIGKNLRGNLHLHLMEPGIHELEVLPSTRKQREENRQERPTCKSWPKLLPFPST